MIPLTATALRAELDQVTEHWTPRVIGRVNDQYVKVAKLLGEFVRHNPIAEREVEIVLIETVTTTHTGDVLTDRTVSLEQQTASFAEDA